jgi:hypothetical protein
MTVRRLFIAVALAVSLAGFAYVGQEAATPGVKMTAAAEKFVTGLTADQKAKAVFDFDDKERTNWHFVPWQKDKKPLRKGLRLDEMTAEQREAAHALVRAGTSADGYRKATTIMSLEALLKELEQNGANVRDPGWYFFTVFGSPSRTGKWGWRVEGHHLSLNFVVDRGRVTGATPAFFGANPALVKAGERKGLRTLPEAEDYARALFDALDDDQRKAAAQPKQFPEIQEGKAEAEVSTPVGLAAAQMNDKQRGLLLKLLEGYAGRMPPEVAAAELVQVKEAGVEKIHFAFAREDDKPGKPYTYRVQGPTFVIMFLNVQADSANNPVNHIHSVWRSLTDDFGLVRR